MFDFSNENFCKFVLNNTHYSFSTVHSFLSLLDLITSFVNIYDFEASKQDIYNSLNISFSAMKLNQRRKSTVQNGIMSGLLNIHGFKEVKMIHKK